MYKKSARTPAISESPRSSLDNRTTSELLKAAGEIFAEVGYEAATIRKICERAGKNIALVKYHFGDKQGLYAAVLKRSVFAARMEGVPVALAQEAPPEEILRVTVKARLRSACRRDLPDWHFRILMHELVQPTPAMKHLIDEVAQPIYERARELIGKVLGLPPDHEMTRLCANSIFGQILIYVLPVGVSSHLWPGLRMTPEMAERIADHIVDFSLAYLRAYASRARKERGAEKTVRTRK